MKKLMLVAAVLVSGLIACSSPGNSEFGNETPGSESLRETTNEADATPPNSDLALAAAPWAGVKVAFNDPNEFESGAGVAADLAGNLYVTGTSSTGIKQPSGYYDLKPAKTVLTKLDPSGAKLWTRTLSVLNRAVAATGIVTDPSGNVYVAGFANAALNTQPYIGNRDAFLVKYNPSGSVVWTREIGGVGDDGVTGIAINGTNIYLTGYACGDGQNFAGKTIRGACDVFVVKYESSGNRLWAKLYGSSLSELAAKIAKVTTGGAVFVGTYQGALNPSGSYGLNPNGFVTRIDPNGNVIWSRTISSDPSPRNNANAVAVSSDAIYVGGYDGVTGFLTKLNYAGTGQWTRLVGYLSPQFDTLSSISDLQVAADGQVYALGAQSYRIPFAYRICGDAPWPLRYDASGNISATNTTSQFSGCTARALTVRADSVFVMQNNAPALTDAPIPQKPFEDNISVGKFSFDLKLR